MEEQRLTNRQIQAINTKNKIYQVAIHLLEKKGYENITIGEICNDAGVSVGSFYKYFESKNDILTEIYKRADDYFYNEVIHSLTSTHTLDQIIEYFDYYAKYNEAVGVDTMRQLYNAANNKMFVKKGRYMQTLLQEIIEKGQDKKEISEEMTIEQITEYLFITARGIIYDWCLHDGQYNLTNAMHKFMERFVYIFK
ncbi:MAG TPA: TetR/AcrR family transcriptional regulator [Negativicutes bacterium]|jgi:AcrR family transcriptional regulator